MSLVSIALLISSASMAAKSPTYETNKDNVPNLMALKQFLLGSPDANQPPVEFKGHGADGGPCAVTFVATTIGMSFSVRELKDKGRLANFWVSRSAGTSAHFQMTLQANVLQASQVSYGMNERDSWAIQELLQLGIRRNANGNTSVGAVRITNASNTNWDANDKPTWDNAQTVDLSCVLN
jgi:hypothetical protein